MAMSRSSQRLYAHEKMQSYDVTGTVKMNPRVFNQVQNKAHTDNCLRAVLTFASLLAKVETLLGVILKGSSRGQQ